MPPRRFIPAENVTDPPEKYTDLVTQLRALYPGLKVNLYVIPPSGGKASGAARSDHPDLPHPLKS